MALPEMLYALNNHIMQYSDNLIFGVPYIIFMTQQGINILIAGARIL